VDSTRAETDAPGCPRPRWRGEQKLQDVGQSDEHVVLSTVAALAAIIPRRQIPWRHNTTHAPFALPKSSGYFESEGKAVERSRDRYAAVNHMPTYMHSICPFATSDASDTRPPCVAVQSLAGISKDGNRLMGCGGQPVMDLGGIVVETSAVWIWPEVSI
jgi:hypothetical protein